MNDQGAALLTTKSSSRTSTTATSFISFVDFDLSSLASSCTSWSAALVLSIPCNDVRSRLAAHVGGDVSDRRRMGHVADLGGPCAERS